MYLTTNIITGQKYIGKHSTNKSTSTYLGSGTKLILAIGKYGKNAFTKEILSEHESAEAAYIAEELEIENRNAIEDPTYYNIVRGGRGGGWERKIGPREDSKIRSGWNHTEEAKTGMSRNHNPNSAWPKGLKRSETNRANSSKAKKGVKCPESAKEKLRQLTGDKNSQYGSFWITNGIVNKKIKNIDIIPESWYKGRTASKDWYSERGKNVR